MDINKIKKALSEFDTTKVDLYLAYVKDLIEAIDYKTNKKKNPWASYLPDEYIINCYKKVAIDGLDFDGKHVTLQKTGISYDYNAFKNKMLLVYPESLIDVDLTYKNDVFKFKKESGRVVYTHDIMNPFSRNEDDIIGGYCVIKNKRGEFLTILSANEIEKHRKVAKTDSIWRQWKTEMYLKTLIKKGCNQHFKDIFENIIDNDNENYDLNNPLDTTVSTKSEIEAIETIDKLKKYYTENKSKHIDDAKGFNKLINNRKAELEKDKQNANS